MRITCFLVLFFLSFCILSYAQFPKGGHNFCKIDAQTFNKKTSFAVDVGNNSRDNRTSDEASTDSLLDKAKSFTNEIVMLDYMNDIGWECFSIISTVTHYQTSIDVVYYFRKPKRTP